MFFFLFVVYALSIVALVKLSYDIVADSTDEEGCVTHRDARGRPLLLAPGDMIGRGVRADSFRRRANPRYGAAVLRGEETRNMRR